MTWNEAHKAHRAFTLIELLTVIAVFAVLASLLFPVMSSMKSAGHTAVCNSNLAQFGKAFNLYSDDWCSRYPLPGKVDPPRICWIYDEVTYDASGVKYHREVGALWPYIRTAMKSGVKNNFWSCPLAVPADDQRAEAFRPGQNYVMNDYIRAGHSGRFPLNTAYPGFCSGFRTDSCPKPSRTILLYEAVQKQDGTCSRYGSPFFIHDAIYSRPTAHSSFGNLIYANLPQDYHSGKSNFLFLDGHVKAYAPSETLSETTFDSYKNTGDLRFWSKVYSGSGSEDLWNPRVGGVRFP